jgi:RNA polymerase sigma-70 factor (ECF subfamily)
MASPEVQPIVEKLFRHEAGKLVAVLTRIFGPQHLELAEDVVQDTLLKALQHWKFHGVPKDPTAWLFAAARNKALDVLRRVRHQRNYEEALSPLLKSEYSVGTTLQQLLSPDAIEDEQLRMMFVCCHPLLPQESQVALILKTLCGFSLAEIAHAFLANEDAISKRLLRARQQFREEAIPFVLPPAEALADRLHNVHTVIYLIFNEGYHASHHPSAIRDDLVEEALRLAKMLTDHSTTATNESLALMALLCFQAARLYSRVDTHGHLLTLKEQDRSLWNTDLIQQGKHYLQRAAQGPDLSVFHVEAAIAYEHASAATYEATAWPRIVQLYDWLYQLQPNGVVLLNRAIALAEVAGADQALTQLRTLEDDAAMKNYALLPATMGDLYARLGQRTLAKNYFERALALTQSPAEKVLLQKKIGNC